MPQSCVRRKAMTSCSSSFEGDCTRISVPWIEAWAFLNFLSLIALTMAFAFSCGMPWVSVRSEEHTSELQSHSDLVCRLLLEKKKGFEKLRRFSYVSQTKINALLSY